MTEKKEAIEISHKLLRGEYLHQAINASMEILARDFPVEDQVKKVASRLRRNATRDRYKFIKDPDIIFMIKIGRILNLIPEYSSNLKIKQ